MRSIPLTKTGGRPPIEGKMVFKSDRFADIRNDRDRDRAFFTYDLLLFLDIGTLSCSECFDDEWNPPYFYPLQEDFFCGQD